MKTRPPRRVRASRTTTLLSAPYDLSTAVDPVVRYARWYTNDLGQNPGEDLFDVEVSNNGGSTWASLEQVGAGTPLAWVVPERPLAGVVSPTANMRFRFTARDLGIGGSLVEAAINGMLTGLDPHSSYMDAKSFRDMQVQTRGEFGGLGIEVTMEDGLVKVVAPIDDTPAARAGIMANDLITHLNDEPVQGLTLTQAVEKMRGAPNTKLKLKILRKPQTAPIEVIAAKATTHSG